MHGLTASAFVMQIHHPESGEAQKRRRAKAPKKSLTETRNKGNQFRNFGNIKGRREEKA
jgi:hypothetical protein